MASNACAVPVSSSSHRTRPQTDSIDEDLAQHWLLNPLQCVINLSRSVVEVQLQVVSASIQLTLHGWSVLSGVVDPTIQAAAVAHMVR